MFSLAYVLLPSSEAEPANAITASLARFERGRRGDVPDDWLRFDDETAHVEEVYRARITFTKETGLRTEGADSFYLDMRQIVAEMERRNANPWTVCFAETQPDIASFVARFMPWLEHHPVTRGFGQWLNGLGRWDWWDLGGRFDGAITGERNRAGRPDSDVNSGPSCGRDVLGQIEQALDVALDQPAPPRIDVLTDNNVELVTRLLADLDITECRRLPGAIVLPPGAVDDECRWLTNWPKIGPADTLAWLDLGPDTAWVDIVRATYRRFGDHWAAGVAFHH